MLAGGGEDKTLRIYDLSAFDLMSELNLGEFIMALHFNPRYDLLAVGGTGGLAKLYSTKNLKVEYELQHDRAVTGIKFSPDGNFLLTSGFDKKLRLWDFKNNREIRKMEQRLIIHGAAFSSDGKYAASWGDDKTARLWDLSYGKELLRIVHQAPVSSLAFVPGKNLLVTGCRDGSIGLWGKVADPAYLTIKHQQTLADIDISKDGKVLATAGWDQRASIWSISPPKNLCMLPHTIKVNQVKFSPSGKFLATIGISTIAKIWKVPQTLTESVNPFHVLKHPNEPGNVSLLDFVDFSPDEKYVATAGRKGMVRIWDWRAERVIAELKHGDRVRKVHFGPAGKFVYTSSFDGTARVWDWSTENEVGRVTHKGKVSKLAVSPQGGWFISASNSEKVIHYCKFEKNTASQGAPIVKCRVIQTGSSISAVTISPNGEIAAISNLNGKIAILHHQNPGKPLFLPQQDSPVNTLAFSRDSRFLASGGHDKQAHIWNIESREEVARIPLQATVYEVAFCQPDNRFLAVVTNEVIGEGHLAQLYYWQPKSLISLGCKYLTIKLSAAERARYIPEEKYRYPCKDVK